MTCYTFILPSANLSFLSSTSLCIFCVSIQHPTPQELSLDFISRELTLQDLYRSIIFPARFKSFSIICFHISFKFFYPLTSILFTFPSLPITVEHLYLFYSHILPGNWEEIAKCILFFANFLVDSCKDFTHCFGRC